MVFIVAVRLADLFLVGVLIVGVTMRELTKSTFTLASRSTLAFVHLLIACKSTQAVLLL